MIFTNPPWVHYSPGDDKTDPTVRRFKGMSYHGNMEFDVPFMSLVTANLWQGGCVTGLILPPNIRHLVSLYPRERYQLTRPLDTEMYVSMRDSTDESLERIDALAAMINDLRQSGQVLVHCQAGLNRSGLVVARTLWQNVFGTGREIVDHLRVVRSPAVLCNPAFEAEVLSWG